MEAVILTNLEQSLNDEFDQYAGKDTLFFDKLINKVIDECKVHNINPSTIFNSTLYSWYYGNIIHAFVSYIVIPKNMHTNGSDTVLSNAQIDELLYVIYKLVITYDINIQFEDYYGMTPYDSAQKLGTQIKLYKHEQLLYVLKHNKNIKLMQNFLIQRYISRKRHTARRLAAAQVITKRALEFVLSPYTSVGQRLLKRRAFEFHEKYTTLA